MLRKFKPGTYNIGNNDAYRYYLRQNEFKIKNNKLAYTPLISIIIICESKLKLKKCLNSLFKQKYNKIEIYLYNYEYKISDKRFKGKITNVNNANGEYVSIITDDNIFENNSYYEFVRNINNNKKIDFIYSDSDELDINNKRFNPIFRPDYSPDTLLSYNYIGNVSIVKKEILKDIEFNNIYDMYLKIVEKTSNIIHLSKILYHSYNLIKYNKKESLNSITNALKRRNLNGKVLESDNYNGFYINYENNNEKVSIVIPIRDNYELTKKCIDSIYLKSNYKNYEVIIINNRSEEEKTYELLNIYQELHENFKVINADFDFNYSKINNFVINKLNTDYVILLNNDTEVITNNWIEIMLGYARQSHIGAVGVKLLYDDNTVQHGGIVIIDSPKSVFTGIPKDTKIWGGRLSVPYNYSAVTAACLMVNVKKYKEVNGLSEELEIAYNDVDFCLKLLEKGYYNIYLPNVELYHYESKTRGLEITKAKQNRLAKEQNIFNKKWNLKDKFYNENLSNEIPFLIDIK